MMKTIWLPTIDSTNSEAFRRLPELASGTVLAAHEQTAGRGQRGNRWYVAPGDNLTFSVVLRFSGLPAAKAFRLNVLCPLAVARFLRASDVKAVVKWPNDVYVGRRKICGILVENALEGASVAASVAGIGINVNQTEFPEVSGATSMSLLTGIRYDVESELERFLSFLEPMIPAIEDDTLWEELFREYNAGLFGLGVLERYRDNTSGREFSAVIRGVTEDGLLQLWDNDSGLIRHYAFKEVGYIL